MSQQESYKTIPSHQMPIPFGYKLRNYTDETNLMIMQPPSDLGPEH